MDIDQKTLEGFSGQISEWKCYIEEEQGNTWFEFDWLIFMFLWKAEISLLQCCCLFNIGFICICQQKGAERPERGGDGLWGLAWQRWRWQILTGEIWIPLMQEAHTHTHTQEHTRITSFQYKFIPFFYSRISHASQQRLTRLRLSRCTKERCWVIFSSSTFCL